MPSDNPGASMGDRINSLEQRLGRARNVSVALAVALVVNFLWAGTHDRRITENNSAIKKVHAAEPADAVKELVRAKRFEVVNDAGKVLVVMTEVGGAGAVVTINPQGQSLVELVKTVDGQGAVIARNAQGKRVVAFGALAGGEGFVTTADAAGNELVTLGAVNGRGSVTTKNAEGKELINLGVSTTGDGLVYTTNGEGRRLVEFGVGPERMSGTIIVYNMTGGAICSVKGDDDGGVLGLWDGHGRGKTLSAAENK